MTTPTPVIRDATGGDIDLVTQILTEGFVDDPVSAWLISDRADRRPVLAGYFRLFVEHGCKVGTVHIADDAAAAVWFPHDAPDAVDLDGQLQTICGRWAPRFTQFGQIMHDKHPASFAHSYLMLLAARPDAQGQGLGGALLAHRQSQLDPTGLPTYLEATTRRSADGVYRRAGYIPLGDPIDFPDGLSTYPLWRDARLAG
jgi:GNAT superfamily N-acetyltransferase